MTNLTSHTLRVIIAMPDQLTAAIDEIVKRQALHEERLTGMFDILHMHNEPNELIKTSRVTYYIRMHTELTHI